MTRPVLSHVPGNPAVVALLDASAAAPVHAYLFVGPRGSGKVEAARAFAAALQCPNGGCDACRVCRLVLAGEHPDVVEVEPSSASGWTVGEDSSEVGTARWLVRQATLSPVESPYKVFVLDALHRQQGPAAAALLKTIEEPYRTTVFLGLVDDLPPDLATIASRCVLVRFSPVPDDVVAELLRGEGVEPARAAAVAAAAGGDLWRARVLALDEGLTARLERFATVPSRLDGTGAAVVREVAALQAAIEAAAEPLKQRHAEELAALDERAKAMGERGSGRKAVLERHKRELRAHRIDELRAGLGAMAATYRDRLVDGTAHRPDEIVAAVGLVVDAIGSLSRNPNETLLLQALLLQLPPA